MRSKERQDTVSALADRLNGHIRRIDSEKAALRQRMNELRRKSLIHQERRGFKIEDVESSATVTSDNMRIIASIRKALDKPYLDDPEFCADAALYAEAITEEIQQLDEHRKQIGNTITAKREGLRLLESEAEKERGDISARIADLLSPMKASNFTLYGETSGAYALNRAKQEIKGFESQGEGQFK